MRNLNGCFVRGLELKDLTVINDEYITGLTKQEALDGAKYMAEIWPEVHVGQICKRYPCGAILGCIWKSGRKTGVCEEGGL